MDPLILVLVPGVLGGLIIAGLVVLSNRRAGRTSSLMLPYRLESVSPHMINMASIKVAGIGGLGLVAMAAVVALGVPQIGQSVGIGLGLGAIAAGVMIFRARKTGGMPSSGQRMGANVTLSIDDADRTSSEPSLSSRELELATSN